MKLTQEQKNIIKDSKKVSDWIVPINSASYIRHTHYFYLAEVKGKDVCVVYEINEAIKDLKEGEDPNSINESSIIKSDNTLADLFEELESGGNKFYSPVSHGIHFTEIKALEQTIK